MELNSDLSGNVMTQSITVNLPVDLKSALDDVSKREGVTTEEVVGQAIKEHLFLRQFRQVRQRLASQAQSRGVLTDQDVFDRVS